MVVYDTQDESGRNAGPRPFLYLPLHDSAEYADTHLGALPMEKIVYRCVHGIARSDLDAWLRGRQARPSPVVLVGSPGRGTDPGALKLSEANQLARRLAPDVALGGA